MTNKELATAFAPIMDLDSLWSSATIEARKSGRYSWDLMIHFADGQLAAMGTVSVYESGLDQGTLTRALAAAFEWARQELKNDAG
jgi:hypothetical protein